MKTLLTAALFLTAASSCTKNTDKALESVRHEPASTQRASLK
jgi:hypothetical protein